MFRFARCHDLISLKIKHQDRWSQESDMALIRMKDKHFKYYDFFRWNVKEMGTLFCTDQILSNNCGKLLEVGPGYNLYFSRNYSKSHEYWMIDRRDYYPEAIFNRALKKRKNTTYVEGLMGDYLSELSNNFFDIVFSVSVLEHVPESQLVQCYKDMFRVLRPGGIIAHSIDVAFSETETLPENHLKAIKEAGFFVEGEIDWKWQLGSDTEKATLVQPLSNVYGIWRPENWKKAFIREYPIGTMPMCQAKALCAKLS
jgi:SAM-dependent methyltransferase